MRSDFHLQFCPGIHLDTEGEDWLIVCGARPALRQRTPGPAARALLQGLAESGGCADDLIARAQAAEPAVMGARLYYLLDALERRGLLSYNLIQDGHHRLATLEPMTADFRLLELASDPMARYRLSRFTILRRDGEHCLVECPLGHARLRLRLGHLAALPGALARPQSTQTLALVLPDLTPAAAAGLLQLLMSLQAVFVCDDAGLIPEDHDPALRQWEPHDLAFHARSRMGRHDYPIGGTFRFLVELPHAPALKPPGPGARIALPRHRAKPDQSADLSQSEPDFFAVLETRRSIRQGGDQPLTRDQLGILLWHVARVQRHRPANPHDPKQYESTLRPVAAGGAVHELELYLTVTRCTGLEPALYRYDPSTHELEWISAPNADTEGLVRDAMGAAGMENPPDVLITLAARFGRLAWKYEGIAYALILKHVGGMYQQLYLVATALGLAPCAIGAGDSQRFAAATGMPDHEESSVGEFTLSGPLTDRSG